MQLSFVITTHNRKRALLNTLFLLRERCGLADHDWEAIVVDSQSTDGTRQAVAEAAPWARYLPQAVNNPCAARNAGVSVALGQYVCFLDDDSRPRRGAVDAALHYFKHHPQTAMLGGPVFLPDGEQDACALPMIAPCCGAFVRRQAFIDVKGFDAAYHMAAEEYELGFRLVHRGYGLARLHAVAFDHDKAPSSRSPGRILRQDLRNNLVLAQRFFPEPLRDELVADWTHRYTALLAHAQAQSQSQAADGNADGSQYGKQNAEGDAEKNANADANAYADQAQAAITQAQTMLQQGPAPTPLNADALERLLATDHQTQRLLAFRQARPHDPAPRSPLPPLPAQPPMPPMPASPPLPPLPLAIAGYTKTIYTTVLACRAAGFTPLAILDDHPAYAGMTYRGIPILPEGSAVGSRAVAIACSDRNPARGLQRGRRVARAQNLPLITMLEVPEMLD